MPGFEDFFGTIAYSSAMNYAWLTFQIVVGGALMFSTIFFIVYMVQFRHKAVVLDAQRNMFADIKRYRMAHKKGKQYIKMFGKDKMPMPPADNFVPYGKKGSMLFLIKDGSILLPIKPTPNPGLELNIREFDIVKNWYLQAVHETYEAYKERLNKIAQYLPWIGFVVMCMVFFLMVIFLLKRFDMVVAAASSVQEASQHAGQQFIPGT